VREEARSVTSTEPAIGRELGPDALDAFTETKNVFISTSGNNS
jgi:hypothetical protein